MHYSNREMWICLSLPCIFIYSLIKCTLALVMIVIDLQIIDSNGE